VQVRITGDTCAEPSKTSMGSPSGLLYDLIIMGITAPMRHCFGEAAGPMALDISGNLPATRRVADQSCPLQFKLLDHRGYTIPGGHDRPGAVWTALLQSFRQDGVLWPAQALPQRLHFLLRRVRRRRHRRCVGRPARRYLGPVGGPARLPLRKVGHGTRRPSSPP
jgi:hypothetical protein